MGGADTASKGPGGTPPAAELAGSLLGPGRTLEGQAGQTQVPGDKGASDFLWKQMGCFQACTLHMLPKPWHWFRAPGGLLPPQAHTGLRGTQSHPEFHTVTRLHTHRRDRRLWGLRQRLLCCSCPKMWGGGETPPGEEPREGNGWEQVPGPVPTPGEGLPGPQALLVPCRPGCPLPLLHAAPEGSWGTLELSEGRKPRQGPRAATRTLANPRPAGASSAHVGWQWQ